MKSGIGFKSFFTALLLMSGMTFQLLAGFDISAEIRPRFEYRHGYGALPPEGAIPTIGMSQRSRIIFNYDTEKIKYGLSLQDVRVWGDETLYSATGVFGDNASLDLKEAWIQLVINKYSSVKIGRQALKYDDERLISIRDWNQTGISYDAILYQYLNKNWRVDFGLSLNNQLDGQYGNFYPAGKLKTLNFLYVKNQISPELYLSFLTIGSGFTANDTTEVIYMRGTYGLYASYKVQRFFFAGSGFFQNGKNKKGKDVSAYFFSIDGGIYLQKFTIAGGIHHLSGQDGTKLDQAYQSKDHLFDILYGVRHRYYGLMDNFSNIPKSTGNGGLIDFFGRVDYKYHGNNYLRLDYHWFYLQNKVADPRYIETKVIQLPKNLGTEVDLAVDQRIYSGVNLKLGYSMMFATESREILSGIEPGKSEFSHWAWMMLTFSGSIYSPKE